MYKYKALKVDGKRIDEHRFIMQNHIGRKLSTNEVVHHIDGNKLNNDISNLEIVSRSNHSRLHTIERNSNSDFIKNISESMKLKSKLRFKKNKLNINQVIEIKSLCGKMKQCDIAKKFNISKTTVSRIFSGELWDSI